MKILSRLIFISIGLLCGQFLSYAQPAGYYDAAEGLSGETLKTSLYGIINNHTIRPYDQLWTDFQITDEDASGRYVICSFRHR